MIENLLDNAFTNTIGRLIDGANRWLGSWLNLDWVPELFWWYWYLLLLFIAISVVIYLFGWSRAVRIISSVIFAAAAIFVAGGHVMRNRLKRREDKRRGRW